MFSSKSFGIGASLVMAAGGVLTTGAPARAGDDFRVSISIGSGGLACRPVVVRPEPVCREAGVLTIDGRRFVIEDSCDVNEQIVRAFRRMGYDAWCVGRSVRIAKECDGPEICWRTGEYGLAFRERRTTITLTAYVEECHDHYGHHHRFAYESHGRERRYVAYQETTGPAGAISWHSLGAATFIEHDRDLDDEVGERPDNRRGDERRVDDRRTERTGRVGTIDRVERDDRSSTPLGRTVSRSDDRKRPVDAGKLPLERKRELVTVPSDRVKAMPSDRVAVAKPGAKATAKDAEKRQDDAAKGKRDTKGRW